MKKLRGAFIGFLAAVALVVLSVHFRAVLRESEGADPLWVLYLLGAVLFIAAVRSLPSPPSPLAGGYSVQRRIVAGAVVFAFALIKGVAPAITAYELSTLVAYERDEKTGKMRSMLSGSLISLFYEDVSMILSVWLGSLLLRGPLQSWSLLTWTPQMQGTCAFLIVGALTGCALDACIALLNVPNRAGKEGPEGREWVAVFQALRRTPWALAAAVLALLLALLDRLEGGRLLVLALLGLMMAVRFEVINYRKARDEYRRILVALSAAIEAKDPYALGYAEQVEQCAALIGRAMRLRGRRLEDLRTAARLHNIGQIGIDDNMLRRAGPLDEQDWSSMRAHPEIAKKIAEELDLSGAVIQEILHHHERYDGTGYPEGVPLAERPLDESILAAAAAFIAMISERPYRDAMTVEQALDVMAKEAGKQFHPDVVQAFRRCAHKLRAYSGAHSNKELPMPEPTPPA
jgi:hypothetical protein